MRKENIERKTNETEISMTLELDGTGAYEVCTGCGFLDHMLELFARHGRFDLDIRCKGDIHVDYHHTVEDTAIALGAAFRAALGDKRGIERYGQFLLPMDEALVLCAVDISGRSFVNFDVSIPTDKVGDFDTELVKEFVTALSREMGLTIHLKQMAGENSHHIIEAVFKGMGRALQAACAIDKAYADEIPSTKGVL